MEHSVEAMLVMLLHLLAAACCCSGSTWREGRGLVHTERTAESSRVSTFISSLSVRFSLSGLPGSCDDI